MREFIALAKQKPGTLNYGSAGPGSVNHLALELLKARTGTDIVHVPYKGIAPATLDLLSGQIQAMTASIPATLPYVAQNKLRVARRHRHAPRRAAARRAVAGRRQACQDADVINYWGIVAPAGTLARGRRPPQCRDAGAARAARRARAAGTGGRRAHPRRPPERLAALIEADLNGWKKLIADAKLVFE